MKKSHLTLLTSGLVLTFGFTLSAEANFIEPEHDLYSVFEYIEEEEYQQTTDKGLKTELLLERSERKMLEVEYLLSKEETERAQQHFEKSQDYILRSINQIGLLRAEGEDVSLFEEEVITHLNTRQENIRNLLYNYPNIVGNDGYLDRMIVQNHELFQRHEQTIKEYQAFTSDPTSLSEEQLEKIMKDQEEFQRIFENALTDFEKENMVQIDLGEGFDPNNLEDIEGLFSEMRQGEQGAIIDETISDDPTNIIDDIIGSGSADSGTNSTNQNPSRDDIDQEVNEALDVIDQIINE